MILSAEKKTKFIDLLTVILFCNNCNCSNCNRKLALLSHFHEFTELEVVDSSESDSAVVSCPAEEGIVFVYVLVIREILGKFTVIISAGLHT